MPLDGFPNGYNVAMAALAAAWEPSEILSLWQWADKKVYLPRGTSPKVGEFRTDRVPMSREIMEVLSPHHPSKKVVAMMSSQLCKTQIGLNFIGYHIEHDPQTILVVYPTVDLAEDWSTDKFTPIAMASAHIRAAMSIAKSRDGSNTILKKSFLGGSLKIAGANTPSSLSSRGGAILYCDEVDRYPQSAGIEGDPITIAERALIAYQDQAKEYLSSTPTIKSLSRINKEFQLSDRRYYHVPCPHCEELQVLAWDNFKWDAGQPHTAHFVCLHNGCVIEEHDKVSMLPDAHMGGKAQWISTNPESKIPGFHAWAAYASLGMGMSWHTLAEKWDECGKDPEKEKAYINIYRGECFDDPTEKLDWEVIKSRATPYKLRTIPTGCLILTGAVDVQGNRIELQILGWGRGGKVWVIDYVALPGDPTQPHVWEALDKLLLTPIFNRFGVAMQVKSCGVDSGYLTDEVLKFVRVREHRGVFALHGSKIQGRQAISTATAQDRNARGKQRTNGVKSWLIGSDTLKHTLFLWLQDDGKDGMDETNRRIHFSNELPDEYFTQLCAEIYDPHKKRWVKQQSRNEALDTFIYNIAGARHPKMRLHLFRESDWARFDAVIEPPTGDLFHLEQRDDSSPAIQEKPEVDANVPANLRRPPSKPSGGFVNAWKQRK